MDCPEPPLVLILGAGINGAACARELVLNGVSVVVVETADIAFGATSKSTRLIHGGLRYLEYGEFALVRESLEERTRLLQQAPQFVRPLRLCIPVNNRLSGLLPSILRFLKLERLADALRRKLRKSSGVHKTRGLWLVRMGLRLYEIYARDRTMPRHSIHMSGANGFPEIDRQRFPWLCAYSDAQIVRTERWVIALLADAQNAAKENNACFKLYTYHQAIRDSDGVTITPNTGTNGITVRLQPAIIINATGAWGDGTLEQLQVSSKPLFAGTKGSHLLTYNERLKDALHEHGIYAEAPDGRLIFVLPFDDAVLIGTTDEPYTIGPETAVADDSEIDYLIRAINELFPSADLNREDVAMHYSGIRPLPRSSAKTPGAVTRRHWIEEQHAGDVPVLTLIGGKLTTCRSLGEQTTDRVLKRLGLPRTASTRDRTVPGGENYPTDSITLVTEQKRIAAEFDIPLKQVAAVWRLVGTLTEEVLRECEYLAGETLGATDLPTEFVRWIIEHEWVTTLSDLIERRLLLVFEPELSQQCLRELANLLAEGGKLAVTEVEAEVARTVQRLADFYGKLVSPETHLPR